MNKFNPLISVPRKFGSLGGSLSIILFLILYFAGKNPLILSRQIDIGYIIIALIFIFFSIKEFRDNSNNGVLRFWQGIIVGFLTYLLISIIYAFFIIIFIEWIDNEPLIDYKNDSINFLMEHKQTFIEELGKENFEVAITEMKQMTSLKISYSHFLQKTIIGLFLTVILSVILRR